MACTAAGKNLAPKPLRVAQLETKFLLETLRSLGSVTGQNIDAEPQEASWPIQQFGEL